MAATHQRSNVLVVVCSWVEYQQAYIRTPRTGTPRHHVVGGVWWWLWWHIVGLSINKPNAQMNLLFDP
ncbi:hypothetical protein ACFOLD_05780 [Kocuria carniphila]|uniref:hypothetical protein n=1 Tax=Kocuria carniphila TaxID=262208 RepID=UPI0036212180